MTPGSLVLSLRSRGVTFTIDGSQMHYRAPAGAISHDELAFLKVHRSQVLEILLGQCSGCGSTLYTPESLAVRLCMTCRWIAGEAREEAA